jgi:hypothetical protein
MLAHFASPAQGSAARAPQAHVKRAFATMPGAGVLEAEHQ